MEQTNTTAVMPAKRSGFLTTLCILSYIGSGLWALISLIGIFASSWIISMVMGGGAKSAMDDLPTEGASAEQIEAMHKGIHAASGLAAMGGGMSIGIFVVSLILSVLSILGAVKMWNLKKVGFWMYSTVNILVVIAGFYAGGMVSPIIGIAFIVMYGLNLKYMS